VAFETSDPETVPALAAVFILGHHFNDRTPANATITTGGPISSASLSNGVGTPLPLIATPTGPGPNADGATKYTVQLIVAPLPQYVLLPPDATATAFCNSLTWN
jgi:hypothetical protein